MLDTESVIGDNALMQELEKKLTILLEQINDAQNRLSLDDERGKLKELEKTTQSEGFWDNPESAAAVAAEAANLRKHIAEWDDLSARVKDTLELAQLNDEALRTEIEQTYEQAASRFAAKEFELKLSGPYDKNSAIISIYAGTGGTDAQDWAEMLLRMYLRYCEKAGYGSLVLDQSPGEEAGIKSVTFEVNGRYAYGKLKGEKGVHRLVRLSPYNADHLRQTSFALVEVMPQIEAAAEAEIDPKELRIDVFRSGGHGGQSVNTTDSAVRITHLPTGIVVAIQNERSQLQNKAKAMAVLQSRLTALMLEQHKTRLSEIKGQGQAPAWGNQIRSYVLHPYTKVKDHRTGAETSQAESVLAGELDLFIEAYLQGQIGK
jgi:peptide chain release factor 2